MLNVQLLILNAGSAELHSAKQRDMQVSRQLDVRPQGGKDE